MINRDIFYSKLSGLFRRINTTQRAGFEHLLTVWDTTYSDNIDEYLAYCLATTYHETAQTMQPIEEYGRGHGRPYGPSGFYGRGYVQLTWRANYEHATTCLTKMGVKCDLVHDPKQALDETIASHVLYKGMIEGWFTGKKLANYFDDTTEDAPHARRIINGLDCADKIAGYYHHFKDAIYAADPS